MPDWEERTPVPVGTRGSFSLRAALPSPFWGRESERLLQSRKNYRTYFRKGLAISEICGMIMTDRTNDLFIPQIRTSLRERMVALMNLVNGLLLLAAAGIIALRYRPVKKFSLLSLLMCVLTAVAAFLSASPASASVGVIFGVLQAAVVVCSFCEVRGEYRARKRRMSRARPIPPAQSAGGAPLAG